MLVLINLDSAVERRLSMARQLDESGIRFERVGVDLRCVRPTDVQAQITARFPGLQFDRLALSNPEIGCWLSHLSAWQALLRSGAAACTVIEDDLILAPGFADAVERLSRRSEFDLVYLGTSSRNVSQRRRVTVNGLAVHKPVGVIFNTWGYSISRSYVERFFAQGQRRIRLPIDHFLGGRGGRAQPTIGVLQPPVVSEDPVLGPVSQIAPYTRRIDRSRLFEGMRRRLLASAVSEFYYSLYRYL
jgi:glycosyl transferase family 25